MSAPHWFNVDGVCPPPIRARLAEAADELERLLPEVLKTADLADRALAEYHQHNKTLPHYDESLPAGEVGLVMSDEMVRLEVELSGWQRLVDLVYRYERIFAETREPVMARATGLADRVWLTEHRAS